MALEPVVIGQGRAVIYRDGTVIGWGEAVS
jgi:hypothetical protein